MGVVAKADKLVRIYPDKHDALKRLAQDRRWSLTVATDEVVKRGLEAILHDEPKGNSNAA